MLPYYIARYGFYEGNVSYRLDPRSIMDVFFSKGQGAAEITTSTSKVQMKYDRIMTRDEIDRRLNEIPKSARPGILFSNPLGDGAVGMLLEHPDLNFNLTNEV